jgi:hypothetical protein
MERWVYKGGRQRERQGGAEKDDVDGWEDL